MCQTGAGESGADGGGAAQQPGHRREMACGDKVRDPLPIAGREDQQARMDPVRDSGAFGGQFVARRHQELEVVGEAWQRHSPEARLPDGHRGRQMLGEVMARPQRVSGRSDVATER